MQLLDQAQHLQGISVHALIPPVAWPKPKPRRNTVHSPPLEIRVVATVPKVPKNDSRIASTSNHHPIAMFRSRSTLRFLLSPWVCCERACLYTATPCPWRVYFCIEIAVEVLVVAAACFFCRAAHCHFLIELAVTLFARELAHNVC